MKDTRHTRCAASVRLSGGRGERNKSNSERQLGTVRVRPDLRKRAARPGGRRIGSVVWRCAMALAAAATLVRAGGAAACDDFAAAPSSRWSIAAGEAGPVLLT